MIGAGTILNPILKIVTTVAILGAVYLFIVKPTLETTENISNRAFDATSQFRDEFDRAFEVEGVPDTAKIQDEVRVTLQESDVTTKDARRLLACIRRANGDVSEMTRCTN